MRGSGKFSAIELIKRASGSGMSSFAGRKGSGRAEEEEKEEEDTDSLKSSDLDDSGGSRGSAEGNYNHQY